MNIYPMVRKHGGKAPGADFLAQVELVEMGVQITCYDLELKKKLTDVFSMPIIRRSPSDRKSGLITHRDEVVEPFTGEFFQEVLYSLHRLDLHGVLK
jgi:hypothetical protein